MPSRSRLRVLFVASRFPSPARRGDQVRAHHQLRILGARHRVTLVCFAPSRGQALAPDLARLCERVILVPKSASETTLLLAGAAASHLPMQTALFRSRAMATKLEELCESGDFDLVHVQLARMAPNFGARSLPGMLDLVDALSVNFEQRARRSPPFVRALFELESRRLAAYERRLCTDWDRLTVVSDVDRLAIGAPASLAVNPNGVDTEHFCFTPARRDPATIVFTGNLGYFANVDAVDWFAREILPGVRREIPDALFTAAGARPSRRLRALERRMGGFSVSADPDDLRPYLARAAVAVAPLRCGSGSPFKILEAMAIGTPVVATAIAASALGAEPGRHLLVADGAEAFADAVARLLRDPRYGASLAREARALVEERHAWERSVAGLEAIYHSLAGAA